MQREPAAVVSASDLRRLGVEILRSAGVPDGRALLVADSLVAANLRGVDSHGMHLLPFYVRQLRAGNVNATGDGAVLSESGACLLFDGRNALGQAVAAACCDHAVRLAQAHGISIVVARNSTHFGAAAYWACRISSSGMIGMAFCNASPVVPPWQGRERKIGTNPICVSVPSTGAGGWLLDMATTTVAMNRIVKAAADGQESLPPGWAMDSNGRPTTSVDAAVRGLLMPLGGYKGSGLGVLVEILCGVLSGGPMSSQVGGLYILERRMGTSQTFLAIDARRFLPGEEFQSRMEWLVGNIKGALAAEGYSEVMVAGDPEWRSEERRLKEGIPIERGVWNQLVNLAHEYGLEVPAH